MPYKRREVTVVLLPIDISTLKIIPLGGIDEIGKNLTVYEYEDDILIVDCGCTFPDPTQVGVSSIIPDFDYLRQNADKIKGVVITHAHEDHISGLPYLLSEFNIPVYATRFALSVIKLKIEEYASSIIPQYKEINENSKVKLGSFLVEFIHVNHSIPEAMALAIKTPKGRVIHTGDFRIDLTPTGGQNPTDIAKFSRYGDKGVKLLVCESTNAERQGYSPSENEVVKSLDTLFMKYKSNRLVISTFASNINRIKSIIEVAEKHGRRVAFTGRSMERLVNIARKDKYIDANPDTITDIYAASQYPAEKVVIVTTGSQGEVLSALQRMSLGEHKDIELNKNDIVILSSSTIPGNEKMVSKVVNALVKKDIKVIKHPQVTLHVSGHAYQEEVKLLYTLIKPTYFIPVHGETVHLHANAENIMSMGHPEKDIVIPSLGSVIELDEKRIQITGKVQAGAVLLEGYTISDISQSVLTERRLLSQNGIIIVVIEISRRQRTLVNEPDIITKGFAYVQDSSELIYNLKRLAKEAALGSITVNEVNWRNIKKSVKENISRYIVDKAKKVPLILPIIVSAR